MSERLLHDLILHNGDPATRALTSGSFSIAVCCWRERVHVSMYDMQVTCLSIYVALRLVTFVGIISLHAWRGYIIPVID